MLDLCTHCIHTVSQHHVPRWVNYILHPYTFTDQSTPYILHFLSSAKATLLPGHLASFLLEWKMDGRTTLTIESVGYSLIQAEVKGAKCNLGKSTRVQSVVYPMRIC